jgi:hypothetical protein
LYVEDVYTSIQGMLAHVVTKHTAPPCADVTAAVTALTAYSYISSVLSHLRVDVSAYYCYISNAV